MHYSQVFLITYSQPESKSSCRAGDTIILAPDQVHTAADVIISQPLKLVGGGSTAGSSRLLCPKGAEAALDFRLAASTKFMCDFSLLHGWEAHALSCVTAFD